MQVSIKANLSIPKSGNPNLVTVHTMAQPHGTRSFEKRQQHERHATGEYLVNSPPPVIFPPNPLTLIG